MAMRIPKGRLANVAKVATHSESLMAVSSSGDRLSTDGFLASHPQLPKGLPWCISLLPPRTPEWQDCPRLCHRAYPLAALADAAPLEPGMHMRRQSPDGEIEMTKRPKPDNTHATKRPRASTRACSNLNGDGPLPARPRPSTRRGK